MRGNRWNFEKNKSIVWLVLFSIVLPLMITGWNNTYARAAETTFTDASNEDTKTIKVGFFKFAGYHDIDSYGNKSGYGYDFIQMISRYDNDTYDFVGYDQGWNEMLNMLDSGQIDILTNVAMTEERQEKYLYSTKTIGNDGSIFSVRDDNSTVVTGNYDTYNGITVGSIKDSVQVDQFETFAKEKGFSYAVKVYDTEEDMEKALTNGEIDGIVSIGLRNLQNEKVIEQINKSDMYVICRREDTALMEQINRAIDRLDQESSNWRSELFDKYYHADQGKNISFLSDELDYIEQLKSSGYVLKVAVNPDRKPYSYYENGKIMGIIPRIFDEVANRIGVSYEIQVIQTREEYQNLVNSGDIDVVLDEIYAISEAYDNGYKLSDPYLSTSLSRIVRTDFNGDIGKIALLKEPDLQKEMQDQLSNNVETVGYNTMQECINAVINGDADATYVYSYAAQIALNDDIKNRIKMNIMMDNGNQFAIGVPITKDYELLSILNKGVNSIENEYIQNIVTDETDYMVDEVTLTSYLSNNPWLIVAIVAIILLIVTGIVLLVLRMRLINEKKIEEENKNRLLREKTDKEAEFVQAMTYVCKTNELVRNVNLVDRTSTDYYLEDGTLKSKVGPYYGFDLGNHNEIFYPEDYEQIVSRFDERKVQYLSQHGGGEEYFEARSKNAQGVYQWYGYTMQAVSEDKTHPCNYIVYKKDINAAKLEEIKTRQNLEDALKLAQKASEAKGQFMSRMSHEIRTPLNAVLGYMSMAKQTENDEEKVKHCIKNSEIAAKHLLNIINDVLDISAIESGKIKIADADFDLKELMESLDTVFSNQAETKKIHFNMNIEQLNEKWVVGDSLRLNQILMNLLSNSMKFTAEGGHVTLSAKEIRKTPEKAMVQFDVSDDGIGMSEEFMSRLYQNFEQENAQTALKYGGSGLGMSITKNLVTMMNGSIDVKSKEGEGTTFTVVLELGISSKVAATSHKKEPVTFAKHRILIVEDDKTMAEFIKKVLKGYGIRSEVAESIEAAEKKIEVRQTSDYMYDLCIIESQLKDLDIAATREQLHVNVEFVTRPVSQSVIYNLLMKYFGGSEEETDSETEEKDFSGIRVLLAEDNDMNMEIATDILTKSGLIVEGVRDGKEALDTFEKSEPGYYQAILMDIQMPIMDGYEATRQIRKSSHPESQTIPIIAMTANAFTEDVSAAISAGMDDHISKPVNFDKLYKSLSQLIRN